MRRQGLTIILALSLTVSIGCASSQGFDRRAISEALGVDPAADQDPQLIIDRMSNVSLPCRLGVFFGDRNFSNRQSVKKVEWLAADRNQLLRLLATLQDERILTDTVVLMDATLRGEDIRGIRQAGARHGADMLLVVEGAAAIDRYNNRSAWWYSTLIGAYLAAGTESDAFVLTTGALWAVRSEWHAAIQTGEGVSKVVGSAVFVEDSTALQEAKERAIQALGTRIIDQLRLLKEELPPAKLPSR
ncbi:MAG: hypothetical protein CV088_11865 [Nitrospira sp. LK70]|nr:hypothetical protein [Nitrospira sp. LK70]